MHLIMHLIIPHKTPLTEAAQAQITRHARRVYIGGLPSSATDVGLDEFFRNALAAVGGTIEPGVWGVGHCVCRMRGIVCV